MARPVNEQHFGAPGKRACKGFELVAQIAAGAVDEDQRRQIGGGWTRQMQGIDAEAANIGELANIGMGLLYGARLEGRESCGDDENENKISILMMPLVMLRTLSCTSCV